MFRFTIRDVLWSMVVVGTVAAWWIERRRAEHFQQKIAYLRQAADFAFPINR
jgi:hypothetical protein